MVSAPPLIAVPAAAVTRVRTWQVAQPIASNNSDPPDARFPRGLQDGYIQRLAADRTARRAALRARDLDQRLVGDGFHQPVAQQVEGRARGANRLRVGHPLLNLGIRERGVGTNGPIVDERATGDDNRAPRDRDVGIAESPIRSQMTHPQFRDLTRSARGGVLMALAASLRVVEWSQAIRDFFHLVEYVLIGLVDGVIARAVAPVVESGGCLRRGARNRDLNRWCGRTHTARRQRDRHGREPHRGARKPDVNHANLTNEGSRTSLPGPKICSPGSTFPYRSHGSVPGCDR